MSKLNSIAHQLLLAIFNHGDTSQTKALSLKYRDLVLTHGFVSIEHIGVILSVMSRDEYVIYRFSQKKEDWRIGIKPDGIKALDSKKYLKKSEETKKDNFKTTWRSIKKFGLIVGIIASIVTIILGYDKIVKFLFGL